MKTISEDFMNLINKRLSEGWRFIYSHKEVLLMPPKGDKREEMCAYTIIIPSFIGRDLIEDKLK